MAVNVNQKSALERRMQASANLAQKKALKQQRYITNKNILSKDSSIVEENTDTKSDANFLEKAWKTIVDIGGNVSVGLGKALEGIVDFGATAVGEVGGIFDKGFKEKTSDFIKRDFTGEIIQNPLENYVGEDSIISGSKLESLIDGAAQGVGQLLPNVALNMVGLGAISMPSLFARSAGNATEEGLQNGANLERSAIYGIASGTVEVLTEGISERLFGKPTTIDRVLGKKAIKKGLLKSAENGLGRVFQEAGGEAIEEMVSEIVSPFLKQIYSADSFGEGVSNAVKEELTLEQWSNVLEAGVVGALTSLAFKPVDNTIRRFNTSYDNMVKLGEISSEVAEYNNYVNKIDAGISEGKIDTTSQLYKDAMVELNQKKANIQKKASEIQFRGNETKINKAQNQLLNSLDTNYGLTASYDKNNKLQFNKTASSEEINNSYNQASYSTSLKGYENDFKYKPTSSAMTEDNLKGFELANKLAKASGQTSKIVFVDDLNINGNENNNNIKSNKINGMYDEESGIIYINKNASAEQVGQIAIMHEFTHSLEGTDAYFRFRNYLVNTLKNNPTLIKYLKVNTKKYGKTIDSFAKKIAKNYQNNGVELSDVDVLSEVVAKFTSEYLFTSQTQINRLCETDLSLGKRIFNWIKSKFSSMGSATKEERQLKAFLKNAETLYQSAIRSAISKGAMERAYLDQIDKNKTNAKEETNVQENTQTKQTTQENSAENIDKTNSEKYSVSNNYTEKDLWKKLTKQEMAVLYKRVNEINNLNYYETQLPNGDYLINTDNKVIISDGKFQKPSIKGIVEFNQNFPNKISKARDYFYEKITNGRTIRESVEFINNLFEEEVAIFYGKENSAFDSESTKQGRYDIKDRENSRDEQRTRSAGETGKTEIKAKLSLNDDIDELSDDNVSDKQEQSINNETDEQSSKNETKEQTINIDVDEVKDTSHLQGQTKNTDAVKYRARLNQEKVYSKTELDELIDNTINKTPDMRLDSKSQEIAVEHLFEKMNNQDNNERLETANTIADFIINNAYYDNFNNEFPSAAQDIVDMVRGQKFQLSEQVRQELMFVYGKKQGQMIYNHYNDNSSKLTPETFVEEAGLGIDLTNSEQDIFLDIYKAYNDAKATIKSYYDERNQLAKDVLTTEEIMSDKKVLVNEILKAYDEKGTKTAYAKLKEKYTNTINKLKNDLRDVKIYSDAFVEFMKANKTAKKITKNSYSASHLENPVVKAYLKEVSKTANIKTISKKAREEMQKLQRVYTLSGEDSMFKDIGNQYDNYEVFGENGEFDQTMADMISTIADGEGDLSANELKLLTRITNGLIHLYKNYDKTFIDGKYVETQKLAEKHLETVNKNLKQRDKTKILKFFWKFRNFVDAHTIWRNLDGYDMEYNPELGILQDKGFFSEFGKMITDGEVTYHVTEMELLKPFGIFNKETKGFEKRLTSKHDRIELELVKGSYKSSTSLNLEKTKVSITLGEAISIYLTSLRPQANFKNTTITLKNKDGTTSVYKMTVEQVNEMYNDFDAVTKNYIKIVQEFFKKSGDLKAKVDKDLYGYTNVEDDGLYFPISRDISQIASNIGDAKLVAEILNAYNLSFNKDVKKGARQSLGILNVYEVIERHARGISMYYGLGIPLRTFNRVFNKRVGVAGEFQTSIKQTLSSVAEATEYIENWLRDVQGFSYNNADKKWSKILSTIRGNYAKFQLGANPRTVLGQASSFFMGSIYLKGKALRKGLMMKTDTKQMYEYAPFTKYRMVEKDAVKAQINVLDKMKNGIIGRIGEALTAPIGWMDNATVKKLWNA